MLFSKKTPEEKMAKLVKRKDWNSLSDYVTSDKETKLALARALSGSDDNSCIDILLRLADSKDDDVITETCETLKKVGTDHVTADLQQILLRTPKENEKLREEISSTIQSLHKRG
jgi:hypothetical protein